MTSIRIPAWIGTGSYDFDIVGESHYQRTLAQIAGPKNEDSKEHACVATINLKDSNPHDHNAVRVDINGKTVGYFSRGDAVAYRHALTACRAPAIAYGVRAKIVGGWDRGNGDVGSYGVKLDFDLDLQPGHGAADAALASTAAARLSPEATRRTDTPSWLIVLSAIGVLAFFATRMDSCSLTSERGENQTTSSTARAIKANIDGKIALGDYKGAVIVSQSLIRMFPGSKEAIAVQAAIPQWTQEASKQAPKRAPIQKRQTKQPPTYDHPK